jgi:hypothetical protein
MIKKKPVKAKRRKIRPDKPGAAVVGKPDLPGPVVVPGRLTRNAIAIQLKLAPASVRHYMGLAGAPLPDDRMKYDLKECRDYLALRMPQYHAGLAAPGAAPEDLKSRKMLLEIKELERQEALASGQMLPRSEVLDTLGALAAEMAALIRQKFEHELPSKYQGKNEVERRQLNVKAVEEIDQAMRAGSARVVQAKETQP